MSIIFFEDVNIHPLLILGHYMLISLSIYYIDHNVNNDNIPIRIKIDAIIDDLTLIALVEFT